MEKLIESLISSVVLVVTKEEKGYENTKGRLQEILDGIEDGD